MRNLLIITRIDFWYDGAGHRARLSSLIRFLQNRVNVTIAYIGRFDRRDQIVALNTFPDTRIEVLANDFSLSEVAEKFQLFMKGRSFDAVLVEYIDLWFVAAYIEGKCTTILDTHDIVSDRVNSFRENDIPYHDLELPVEEEFRIFDCFDYVIAIHHNDYNKIALHLGHHRTLLVPHAVTSIPVKLREKVTDIGFVASEYAPNVNGILWFITTAWPGLHDRFNVHLNIYGNVCFGLTEDLTKMYPGIRLHYYTADLNHIYESNDIMINPVKAGAGLKIKNVEAIARGLPLVTTSHGASGMESEKNNSFLVADKPSDFVNTLSNLITNPQLRARISTRALNYAQQQFTPQRCYQSLLNVMMAK